jgi:uncharacterized protein
MKKALFLMLLTFIPILQMFAQWTVESVPNPKTKDNTFVSNPDNILTAGQIAELNAMIQAVEDSATAQIAVVMLQSIGTEVPKEFATELFNLWGVGAKGKDNGLLILFVMDQKRIEFETGYSIEQILTDGNCYQIQQDYMIPQFKEGNYGQGILDGVKVIVDVFMGNRSMLIAESVNTTYSPDEATTEYNYYETPDAEINWVKTMAYYLGGALIALAFYGFFFIITFFQRDYFIRYKTLRIFKLYIWFLLFPIPFIPLYYFTKKRLESWRNTPRISPKTGKLMRKLSEEADNKYLDSGQIAEEAAKSVDYDVWISDEPDDILILSYKRWFSSYSSCPKCKYKTYYKEYDRVINSPTYSSSGTGERKHTCTNCRHSKTVRYTIPRKTKSSTSSSSYGSYGGSSSYGGGSFGGGRSGGGGSGSSW